MDTDFNMEGIQDVEDHMAKEKIPHLKQIVHSSILDSFDKLESNVESSRVVAGIALLRHLHQKQHESENGIICIEINYALKRLIRGLGTKKPHKRAGFFSVLVEVLILFPNVTVQDIMKILANEHPVHCCSKKEFNEAYEVRVWIIGALIHSNRLIKESANEQRKILEKLISAGQKKKTLLVGVFSFLTDFMHKIDEEHFKAVVWPSLKPELNKSWEEHTLDSLNFLLIARKLFPEVVRKKFLVNSLGSKDIIHEETVLQCSKQLMNLPIVNHPIYEEVCCQICTLGLIVPFWEALTKENELRPSQLREQSLLSFLDLLLQHMPEMSQIPELLCDSFMELIIKTFQTKKIKADLAQKANELFTKMSNLLENENIQDEIRINFIKRILFFPGNLMFDKMAGTNIVTQLSSHMTIKSIEKIAKILRNVISAHKPKVKNSQGETCLWSKWERTHAAQLFTRLLSLPVVQENTEWKVKQLKFLVTVGLVASQSRDPDFVNHTVALEVRNCIFKVLDQKVSKIEQLIALLTSVVHYLHEILFIQVNPVKLRQPLTESSVAAWHKMIAFVNEAETMQDYLMSNRQSGRQMFRVLFLHMGLQLLQNATLAEEALQELHCCYERTVGTSEKKEKKKNMKSDNESEEPFWVEVTVDLLLSLLSHDSHLLRNIVCIIFPHLCSHLTPTSVHQIIQVLDPHGKQPLSNPDTEEEDESEGESDAEESSDKETEEVESGSDDDDDDVTGNEPVDAHLKLAVHNALKKAGGGYDGSDEESIDMDQMTEEQRNGLDTALSEAFKLIKHTHTNQKHKKQSKDDETLMHFRVRVLDLLNMYLTNQPALGLVLDIILPLFELLEFCIKDNHQKPLENRVRYCLKKLSIVKHFSNTFDVDQELLSVVLRQLLQKGERAVAVYQNMSEPLIQCSTFLARTSHNLEKQQGGNSPSKNSPFLDVYEEALVTFFKQRDSLLPLDVIKSVLPLTWRGAWKLADVILDFAFDMAVRPFRRNQALQLLIAFFSNGRLITDASPKLTRKLQKLEEKLSSYSIQVLVNIVNEKEKTGTAPDVKERYIKELFCLLYTVWHAHNKSKEVKTTAAVDWDAVKQIVSQYWKIMSLARETKLALKKLATVLHISLIKKEVMTEQKKSYRQQSSIGENEINGETSGVKESGSDGISNNSDDERENSDDESNADTSDDTGDKGYESGNDKETVETIVKKRKRPVTNNLKAKMEKRLKEARRSAMADGLDSTFSFAQIDFPKLQELTDEREVVVDRKAKRKRQGQMDSVVDNYHVSKSPKTFNFHKSQKKAQIKGTVASDSLQKKKKCKVRE